MATLLLTATQEVSEALAKKLEALGHQTIIVPLLQITELDFEPVDFTPQALLITSRYALEAANAYTGLPLYVVGQQTAELAEAQGHYIAYIAPDILSIEDKLPCNTLYLRGKNISHEVDIPARICYAATAVTFTAKPLPEYDAAIVLSARAAELLPYTAKPVFCLSERIKQALASEMQSQTTLPSSPTEIALLETIKRWSASQ